MMVYFIRCFLYIFRVDFLNLCDSHISIPHTYWPPMLTHSVKQCKNLTCRSVTQSLTSLTRTGKRTQLGLIKDGWNSLIRYYKNNFSDGFRQVSVYLMLIFGYSVAVSLLFLSNTIPSHLGINNFLLSVPGFHRLVSWELFSG